VPRRPLARGTLSPDLITDAALTLADAEGIDALTMRRLAQSIGCEAMSLYKHVPNKDALLDLLVERILREFVAPGPRLGPRRRLVAVADELRRLALAHPHVFPLVALRLPGTAVALGPVEVALDALTAAGLPDAKVVSAFWALVAYVTGALLAECAAATGVDQPFPFALDATDRPIPPNVARLRGRLAVEAWEQEYHRGLDLLLGSVLPR
jgi:TetR/AcrR family transcriptional regulator, tetracycline repressor protein